ncbi:mitochondrial import translocase, subunit Tom22 [Auriculariales sp. MPI-PUGE-AT-0066]|nr:mitochondrial import translocase, subunit Tom22 [Auriculariales sp. MPI-PUGE-AT-0066]
MVKVEIVSDSEGPNSPYSSGASSAASSTDSLDSLTARNESFLDRVVALVDIVPPATRHTISTRVSNTVGMGFRVGKWVGNIVWVVTTSALLVGLPLALALEDEAKIIAQEREMQGQQEGVQQMLGASPYGQPAPGQPGQKPAQGLVPPGF